ncbi:uncharacterized protein [Apostichopus japonicus]|uniref:uncharacterized protein n=1 Tax=Stichopus japonicus TaxID=307972 RepID=UPI003AB1FF18
MKLQGLDTASGIWMFCKKLEERNGEVHVKWIGYSTTSWLPRNEVREHLLKRPLRVQPRKQDWPVSKHPSKLQRTDSVTVKRNDGSTGGRLTVHINDPYRGHIVTACNQTIRYELLTDYIDSSDTDVSPTSPSQPPSFVEDNHLNIVNDVAHLTIPKKPRQKKRSTVDVRKKGAKVLCIGESAAVSDSNSNWTVELPSVSSAAIKKAKQTLKEKTVGDQGSVGVIASASNEVDCTRHEEEAVDVGRTEEVGKQNLWQRLELVEQRMERMESNFIRGQNEIKSMVSTIMSMMNKSEQASDVFADSMNILHDEESFFTSSELDYFEPSTSSISHPTQTSSPLPLTSSPQPLTSSPQPLTSSPQPLTSSLPLTSSFPISISPSPTLTSLTLSSLSISPPLTSPPLPLTSSSLPTSPSLTSPPLPLTSSFLPTPPPLTSPPLTSPALPLTSSFLPTSPPLTSLPQPLTSTSLPTSPPLTSLPPPITSSSLLTSPPHTSSHISPTSLNHTKSPTEHSTASNLPQEFLRSLWIYADKPTTLARKLAKAIFTVEEMVSCNCNGTHGKPRLPSSGMTCLYNELFKITQTPIPRRTFVWKQATTAIDSLMRSMRSYKKKKISKSLE